MPCIRISRIKAGEVALAHTCSFPCHMVHAALFVIVDPNTKAHADPGNVDIRYTNPAEQFA